MQAVPPDDGDVRSALSGVSREAPSVIAALGDL